MLNHSKFVAPVFSALAGAIAEAACVLANDARRFPGVAHLADDHAFQSMPETSLFAFTRKLAQIVDADREGNIFTVAQVLNRKEGLVFAPSDSVKIEGALTDISAVLEGWASNNE